MAEVIEDPGDWRVRFAGQPQYPWDDWLNGQVWKLDPVEDIQIPLELFRANAYANAMRRGLKLITRKRDGALWIQAFPRITPPAGSSEPPTP